MPIKIDDFYKRELTPKQLEELKQETQKIVEFIELCDYCNGPPYAEHAYQWSSDGPECNLCGFIHKLPNPCSVAEDGECPHTILK